MNEEFYSMPDVSQISEPMCALLARYGYMEAPQSLSKPAITRRPGASVPLSFAQQQVWLHAQLAPGVPLYNEALILGRTGPLDLEALERSFREITRRHGTLRTTFPTVDETPVPVIVERQSMELPVAELNALSDQQRKTEVLRIATEEVRQPFDLAKGPLMRARLLRLSQENYVLVVTLHTIIADEWSLNLLACELGALYQAYSAGEPSPLCDLPIQYADYAHWQRSVFQGDVLEQQVSYWLERLAGIPPVLELPTDRPRPPRQGLRGNRQSLLFSKELSESLKALSEREGVTLFTVLLATFQALLSRYTGHYDVVLGSIVPGRDRVETRSLIGLFAHTVVIRTDLGGDPTFRELLRRVRDALRRDYEHQDVPVDRLLIEPQPKHDPSRNPLFRVLFSLAPLISPVQSGWETADFEVDTGAAKVDLQLQLYDTPEGIVTRFTYDIDLFDSDSILRMAGHFRTLLQGIVSNPDQFISRLPLLTPAERHQLLVEWNDTHRDYPKDQCVHQLFEEQVGRTPEATAVVCEQDRLSYRELNARANQLAHYLKKLGVGPDVPVALFLERSLEMVIAILGVVKAGGAYLPIDPVYPKNRMAFMLEDANTPVLLTQSTLAPQLAEYKANVICLDTDSTLLEREPDTNPTQVATPDNLVYVIYTSGSTGNPKGVPNVHKGVVNRLLWMQGAYQLDDTDRVLQKTPYSFDVSVWEFFWPVMTGACLVVARPEGHKDPNYLVNLINEQKITTMHFVPSMLHIFLDTPGIERCTSLRQVFCSGEALPFELQERFFQALRAQLHNLYGPTEAAVDVTYWHCMPNSGLVKVPIGRPIWNTQIYILDRYQQPVPVGISGELHIGGIGLARGYLKRPELTAEKFVPDPFSQKPGARLYKTGDLARFLPDGNIEYLGRIDNQVKVRGFRIELGEIEAVLRQHHAVNETVVVAREDVPGDKRLVAYFVPAQTPGPTFIELRNFLKEKLPEYMVPSAFVRLETMPLTANGKVDRKALPDPQLAPAASRSDVIHANDEYESQLVTIWEALFRTQPISTDDNFWELGGHSLLAARLMHRIEQVFGKRLPLSMLLQTPTIEGLASVLRRDGFLAGWSSLVPIQTNGSRLPFFCVHGIGGNVVGFEALARHLGPNQPFYGLQARGLDGKHRCHTRVEDMAAHYIREMHAVQPHGPYLIGGLSFGGWVALEMAMQLQDRGEEVELVALLDSNPGHLRSLASSLADVLLSPTKHKLMYLLPETVKRGIRRRIVFRSLAKTLKDVQSACATAERNYHLRPYTGRITLFRASTTVLRGSKDPQEGWRKFAGGGLEVHVIAGHHVDIIAEPHVRFLAQNLTACLARAQGKCVGSKVLSSDDETLVGRRRESKVTLR